MPLGIFILHSVLEDLDSYPQRHGRHNTWLMLALDSSGGTVVLVCSVRHALERTSGVVCLDELLCHQLHSQQPVSTGKLKIGRRHRDCSSVPGKTTICQRRNTCCITVRLHIHIATLARSCFSSLTGRNLTETSKSPKNATPGKGRGCAYTQMRGDDIA